MPVFCLATSLSYDILKRAFKLINFLILDLNICAAKLGFLFLCLL